MTPDLTQEERAVLAAIRGRQAHPYDVAIDLYACRELMASQGQRHCDLSLERRQRIRPAYQRAADKNVTGGHDAWA